MLNLQAEGKTIVLEFQDALDMLEIISDLKANGCADWNIARILVLDHHYSYLQAKALLLEWQKRKPKLA